MRPFQSVVAVFAVVGLGAFATAGTAFAQQLDASTLTCKELIEASNSTKNDDQFGAGAILHWISGYLATQDQGTVMDFGAMKTDFGAVLEYCNANPEIGVMTAAEKYMGDNASEASADIVDLSTVKCQRVIDTKPDDVEGLSVILMWLAGYNASYKKDTIIDFDKLAKEGEQIGKFCGESPDFGLVTATNKFMGEDN